MSKNLKFKYSSSQPHQIEAVNSICDLFRGQEFISNKFTLGSYGDLFEGHDEIGHANNLFVSEEKLISNLHEIQERNSLPPTCDLSDNKLKDFSVEMETGTGKTYVYIKTIYELNKKYGLTKFVIVVPSVAIREGVKKSFESTKEHFSDLYNNTPLDCFIYDSDYLGKVANYALSSSIQVMIINIAAFNREIMSSEKKGTENIFHRQSEKLIGGKSPQELVSSCNPIVIIDEPQSVDNTDKAQSAIKSLNPMFILRYSATHKRNLNKIYQLGPVDAYQQNLVKGIVVDSVIGQEDLNGSFVKLLGTDNKNGFTAKLSIDVKQKDGSQQRKSVVVKTHQDLFTLSNENNDYRNGWIISNIGTEPGEEFIEFLNGEYLELGDAVGDVATEAIKRAQIKSTIENHLERQLLLYHKGIKVLSLFFIDKVDKYRLYEPEIHNGEYAEIFEEEYKNAVNSKKWQKRYKNKNVPLPLDPSSLHQGYFARDGKGKFKNSSGAANTKADSSAYELIMKEKETLVSLPDGKNESKDIAFIFSHSALKEGWDNPNVFQICTLVETRDQLTKRQKIGRGLRLPVNQKGERNFEPDDNVLTVIANESYELFAEGLQSEFEKSGCRFSVLSPESFSNISIQTEDGNEELLGYAKSKLIFDKLVDDNLIKQNGKISNELKELASNMNVDMPEGLEEVKEDVCSLITSKVDKVPVKNKHKRVNVELDKDVSNSPEFQALWERIRQTTKYNMTIASNELINLAVEKINKMAPIRPLEISSFKANLDISDKGVKYDDSEVRSSVVNIDVSRLYKLPDPLAELQDSVGLTRRTLKEILESTSRLDEFHLDPVRFLTQVTEKIELAKYEVMAKGIKYTKKPDSEWYTMDILQVDDLVAYIGQNALELPVKNKSLYNYVVYDSSTVEKPFALELDQSDDIKVFAKLPSKFIIDTPLGSYNPDWAYVQEVDGKEKVYFVVETKGKPRGFNRPLEELKIDCAEKHFKAIETGIVYETRVHYSSVRV